MPESLPPSVQEPKKKDGRGRPKHIFTNQNILDIEEYAWMPEDKLAAYLGCSETALQHAIKNNELVKNAISKGRHKAGFNVMATAYQMAISGKVPAMTIFWLKVREGWKEPKNEMELSTAGGLHIGLDMSEAAIKEIKAWAERAIKSAIASRKI